MSIIKGHIDIPKLLVGRWLLKSDFFFHVLLCHWYLSEGGRNNNFLKYNQTSGGSYRINNGDSIQRLCIVKNETSWIFSFLFYIFF